MNYWLIKSEAGCYSINDLKKDKKTAWTGVRNYQARIYLREMQVGDLCLFYHSSTEVLGIYGLAKVTKKAFADPTQFDPKDEHYEPKAAKDKPIWEAVEVQFVKKFKEPITLSWIKLNPKLSGMEVAKRGSRLSVQRVSEKHFEYIEKEENKKLL